MWVSENKQAHLFVRTVGGQRSTVRLVDVGAMNLRNVRQGNIIFDVVFVPPSALTPEHIGTAYDSKNTQRLLAKAQEDGLSALEINPSYGADGVVLFRNADIVPGHVLG